MSDFDDFESDFDYDEQCELFVDRVIHTTDKACLCLIDGEEYWIPWSQIDDGSDVEAAGDSGTIYIPLWLAQEKGLDD